MQEQLSNLQRAAVDVMSSRTEQKKRVSKAKAKANDTKSVKVTRKRKKDDPESTFNAKNIQSEAAHSLSSLSSD